MKNIRTLLVCLQWKVVAFCLDTLCFSKCKMHYVDNIMYPVGITRLPDISLQHLADPMLNDKWHAFIWASSVDIQLHTTWILQI